MLLAELIYNNEETFIYLKLVIWHIIEKYIRYVNYLSMAFNILKSI